MEWLLFIVIAASSLFLSTGVIAAPLIIGCLLATLILFKKSHVVFLAFCVGIITDILTFRIVGTTSLFLLLLLSFVFLYERKFEIHTIQFVVVISFLASLVYLLIFQLPHVILGSAITAGWAAAMFFLLAFLDTRLPQRK